MINDSALAGTPAQSRLSRSLRIAALIALAWRSPAAAAAATAAETRSCACASPATRRRSTRSSRRSADEISVVKQLYRGLFTYDEDLNVVPAVAHGAADEGQRRHLRRRPDVHDQAARRRHLERRQAPSPRTTSSTRSSASSTRTPARRATTSASTRAIEGADAVRIGRRHGGRTSA